MATKKVEKTENSNSNYGLIAYVLGIVALVEAFISPLAGVVLGIIGLSFAVKEKTMSAKKAKILNILAIVAGVLFFTIIMVLSWQMGGYQL